MTIRAEHEMHRRRLGRNVGLGVTLAAFILVVFGLTVAKVSQLGERGAFAHAPPGVVAR
ncbi:hypothetical protein LV780_02800 [Cereibacter azotoformans]|uniref:Cytochrome C oxidase assembly protein n=1 Tax=Cereibacter azotoformans TaxID=43057 RepID=A0A2T5K6Y5_9RHOB|nr:hypothetical protein [Cereibacter azotoformans]AXQ92840.1 hypothetical protein D0Z66_02795 [Cereibacter sphaeroides]MBO4169493.1 hypothetical protein [Cereibacter azotoformans]PTR18170.1 hypothetical protein C8J28_109128 [Cereibacter azotoformans]UIJ31124.1 hypothetical protein LV780_02800 [Cereibacter azotoformans]